jgi:thiamine-monophosphate kinase
MKTLGGLGEREAIKIIEHLIKSDAVVGIGDDCAAIDIGNRYLLITTDMMVTKWHMPKGMGPYDIGWSIIAVNLSDIAAMGGKPLGLVTAIGITRGHPIEFLEQMVDGMNDCARRFNTSVVGGDTKEHEDLVLCGTAFGEVDKDKILLRKGAKPGDSIAVTGVLGRAGAGYHSIKRGLGLSDAVAEDQGRHRAWCFRHRHVLHGHIRWSLILDIRAGQSLGDDIRNRLLQGPQSSRGGPGIPRFGEAEGPHPELRG